MVVSNLIIETLPDYTEDASSQLAKIPQVEVRGVQDYQVMVTITAETVHESHDIANKFIAIDGVCNTHLISADFEDDTRVE